MTYTFQERTDYSSSVKAEVYLTKAMNGIYSSNTSNIQNSYPIDQ